MNKPMIENSDRGITLNKSLAWAILAAVAGGGLWVGTQVATLSTGIESLSDRQGEDRRSIRANAEAIGALRSSNARIDQRLLNIEQSSSRTESSVQEILRYLRAGNERDDLP